MMRSSPERIQDITKVEISAEERSGLGDVTLVLRRVDEGEQLWDIAKQYATTAAAIRAANDIPEEEQAVGAQMLLIPIES